MKKILFIFILSLALIFTSCTEGTSGTCPTDDLINFEDVREQINYANSELVKGITHIQTTSYNTGILGQITTYSKKSGSGVIFYEDESSYYYLTNNHVVYKEDGFSKASYEAYDCYCNRYESVLLFNDPNYDLAILKMAKSKEALENKKPLHVFKLAEENAINDDIVFSIGHPNNVVNVVTVGYVKYFGELNIEDSNPLMSNVKFPVIKHDAPTDHGNSGGALINLNYELVGINYAAKENNGVFSASYAIPILKVREFLDNTIFKADNNE